MILPPGEILCIAETCSEELYVTVMRCRVLVGITLTLWGYILLEGLVFHLLESEHEDETINKTLDAFYNLLQACMFKIILGTLGYLRPSSLVLTLYSRTWWRHQMEHFPHYWPYVRAIHRSPVNFPRKGQWRGALIFSLTYAWINVWVNNHETGDLRRQRTHYDVIVMNIDVSTQNRLPWHCKKLLHVPGCVLKCLKLITAPGSVSDEPGSVMWLTTQVAPSSYFIIFMLNHLENIFKQKFDSCQTWIQQHILLWLCCTQAAGIRLGTGVKCSKSTHRYKERLPSPDSWIDNLDMVMDFINFSSQFCQYHYNPSSVIYPAEPKCLTSQQGMLGDFIVFCWSLILITITIVEGKRPFPHLLSFHPTYRGFSKWENVCYKTY